MYNTSEQITDEMMAVFYPIFIFALIIYAVLFIYIFIDYLIKAVAIMKLSKARGLKNGWFGFLPYLRDYQLGSIAGEIQFGGKRIKNPGIWLIIMPFIYSFIISIGMVIMMVPYIAAMLNLGDDPAPEQIVLPVMILLVSSLIFSLIVIIAQVILYLFRGLTLHKIFSQHNEDQKPVFYLIIALFVPMAESIILFKHGKKPLLEKYKPGSAETPPPVRYTPCFTSTAPTPQEINNDMFKPTPPSSGQQAEPEANIPDNEN